MYRGRGSLEVKASTNPFMVRTSNDFGIKHIGWSGAVNPDFAKSMTVERPESFSFLYTRESDNIGGKVHNPLDTKPRVLTKTEFLKKWRAEQLDRKDLGDSTLELSQEDANVTKRTTEEVEKLLTVWKQGTKDEDPRYTSTNNVYGFKAPTVATFVADRAGRPQGFSNSFQGIKPQNSGLNCGLSKSTVHPSLDPQFA